MKKRTLLFGLMILAFILILIAGVIHLQTGKRPLTIAWSASVIVLFSTLLWRFWALDKTRWIVAIEITDPLLGVALRSRRYPNMMVAAMGVGLVATIVIYYNFLAGAAIYLLMQLCLIAAHSGILHLNPRRLLNSAALRKPSQRSLLFWLLLTPLVFIFFVYNGRESLIVAPYVAALGMMAAVVSLGLAYKKRPPLFRWLSTLGAVSFFFSDAIIGHVAFVNPDSALVVIISPTYVLAIILLSHASLGWSELWQE